MANTEREFSIDVALIAGGAVQENILLQCIDTVGASGLVAKNDEGKALVARDGSIISGTLNDTACQADVETIVRETLLGICLILLKPGFS